MKTSLLKIAAIAAAALSALATVSPSAATTFGQKEIDQESTVAIAAPRGTNGNGHQLLILEQISDTRKCWSESGSAPVEIDPLLLNFDFTGICGRATDSNGYSIRMAGSDLGLEYSLRVQRQGDDLVLVGVPDFMNPNAPTIEVGRTHGYTSGFAKIILNPGWRLTKRTYNDKTLGHTYLTHNLTVSELTQQEPIANNPDENPTTPAFGDIAQDIYASEITEAVNKGFIAGFREDNTFRPTSSLTREQLVSMVMEALKTLPNADIDVSEYVSYRPYSDVSTGRWSAAKIQWARDNGIVSGYKDGSFRPTQLVTRAEMMAVLRRAAEYGQNIKEQDSTVTSTKSSKWFSDTSTHWASAVIDQMSGYCEVASPLNEVGSRFYPDTPAMRNYAAAATLRMLNCLNAQ